MTDTCQPWDGIPLSAAALVLTDRPDLTELAGSHVRLLGTRPEVDLASLAASGDRGAAVAAALRGYWAACDQLWEDLRAGHPSGAYVMVRRAVVDAVQRTGKKDRADLTDQFNAVEQVPALARALAAVTEPAPDPAELAASAGADGQVTLADGAATVSVPCTGVLTWPAELGGSTWPGEVRRTVVLAARHAAWRDRRVRRLARVTVHVDEVWPDPSGAAAALPS